MTVHIQKLSSIADKLRELGQPVDNMQLVTKALATIPEKFRIVRSIWANVPLNERTIDNLLQRLRLEENVARSYENNVVTNQAAYPAFHQRTKHIDVRLFYIREAQESGKVNIIYTNTEQQLADIFTKALAVPKFEGFREALGIVQIPI